MDEAADLLSNYFNNSGEHNFVEFSAIYEVGLIEEDIKNGELVNDSQEEMQEMFNDRETEVQDVEINPGVQKTNKPVAVSLEAKRLQASIREISPDLVLLVRKLGKLHKRIASSDVRKDPRAEKLLFEVQLLIDHIFQTRSELINIATDVKKLLPGKMKTSVGSNSTTDVHEDDPLQRLAQIAELSIGDVPDNFYEGNSDDDTSPFHSALKELETAVYRSEGSKTVTTVQSPEATSKLNSHTATAMVKNCKAGSKLDTSNAPSTKRLQESGVKFCNRKIKFQCHLCGAVTQSGNDHMKEKHPNEKEFPCQECDEKFDDFESLCYHKMIHQKENAKKRKRKPPANFQCDECGKILKKAHSLRHHKMAHQKQKARSPMQKPPSIHKCDECGKIFNKPYRLRQHKMSHTGEKPYLCRVCGKAFKWRRSALFCKHGEKVEGDNMSKTPQEFSLQQESCGICGEIFRNVYCTRVHLKEAHNVQAVLHYPCLICNDIFYLKVDLHTHLDLHSSNDNQQFKCKVCDESFLDPVKLREHLLEHNKKFTCEFCGKKFLKMYTLQSHRRFHLEQVTCQICGRILRSEKSLEEHMNRHTGEKPYECDICHMKLFSDCALQNHKSRRHPRKNGGTKCYICGEMFKTSFARNSHHISAHTEEERKLHDVVVPMFKCDICGKTVRAEYKGSHLYKHKSEVQKKPSVCEICGQGFVYFSQLKEHLFHVHNDVDSMPAVLRADRKMAEGAAGDSISERCTCDICGKQYSCKASLYSHRLYYHKGEKSFVCQICGKAFRIKAQLRLHESIHSGTEPHRCEVCGKGFLYKALLSMHYRCHSREKPHTCQVCGVSFSLGGNLVRHVRAVHKKERRFQCEFCSKCFAQNSSLITHRRIHTGEKPFSCPICGRPFSDRGSLHKHKQLHAKKSANIEIEIAVFSDFS